MVELPVHADDGARRSEFRPGTAQHGNKAFSMIFLPTGLDGKNQVDTLAERGGVLPALK
ncbi:hypothetical protein [Jiella marina]|uniref:hypothetical protein n=1 Tax=Jiella sp. LLJ827 TaxID=2917712 RepID=UPI0021012DE2|nr:hypothetical protein [Jiella sp. LLJ827]MCQ0987138.1 hypothetical protein [Jiella sp. LLJ827]